MRLQELFCFITDSSHGPAVKVGKGHFNYTPEDLPGGLLASHEPERYFYTTAKYFSGDALISHLHSPLL